MAKPTPIQTENAFGKALQFVRKSKGVAQEQFDVVSSRTYVSSLERGLKCPTLKKVDELAAVLQVHPATLMALAYVTPGKAEQVAALLRTMASELEGLGAL